MSFYESRVLPHVLNVFMSTKALAAERRRCLEQVEGAVLEVGFGSGHNLPYYPRTVTKVVGIDPSERSAKLARRRIAASPFPVETVGLSAENILLADGSFSSVVSTFTLCTIPDVAHALEEIRRVLRQDGRLYFVEHGRADDPKVVRWQKRLNSIQQHLFGGCHLDRRIAQLIQDAGFEIELLENSQLKGAPKFAGFLYRGVAKPAR
jgi:ubiquinone/menaquinone biosynthesis C-methylase UbiE